MEKHLIREVEAICRRYNLRHYTEEKDIDHYLPEAHYFERNVTVDNFEENIDWLWVSKNYHVSQSFIYEYEDKLDMTYLKENHVLIKDELNKIIDKEKIHSRFEILDL